MRIQLNGQAMEISRDMKASLTLVNPIFNNEGTYGIGFNLCGSDQNIAKLGFPDRTDHSNRVNTDMEASITIGPLVMNGTATMTGISSEGIEFDFLTAEGYFYDKAKEITLNKIVTKQIHWPSIVQDPADPFVELYKSCEVDNGEYTAFELLVKKEGEYPDTKYRIKNQSVEDGTFGTTTSGRSTDGYAPFLYVHYILSEIFKFFDLDFISNPFATGTKRRLVVLNNLIDGLSNRLLDYSFLVPDVTALEFLKCIEQKFGCCFVINYYKREVRCVEYNEMHNASAQLDWSNKLGSTLYPALNPAQKLKLESNTSLEGASPASSDWRKWLINDDSEKWKGELIKGDDNVSLVKGKGWFARRNNVVQPDLEIKSSTFYSYTDNSEEEELEITSTDECVSQVYVPYDINYAPYFADKDLPYFPVEEKRKVKIKDETTDETTEESNTNCPIGFCFFLGKQTLIGRTNTPYGSSFNQSLTFGDGELSLEWIGSRGLFRNCYFIHNEFYKKANQMFSCRLNLTEKDIMMLEWDRKVMIHNQCFYIDKIELTLAIEGLKVDNVTLRRCII